MIQRREFITLLSNEHPSRVHDAARRRGGVAARGAGTAASDAGGWNSSARNRPGRLHIILAAFRRGLAETGYLEGQNVTIEYRLSEGRLDRLPELAADLVRRRVNVIATPSSAAAALAAKAATQTIPIAFAVPEDPVRLGLVASLARPGGNATGINFFTAEVMAKRLGLLLELVPRATRVAVLVNPANVGRAQSTRSDLEPAARVLGLQTQFYDASTSKEIDAAYATLVRERPDALFVGADALFTNRRVQADRAGRAPCASRDLLGA